MEKIDYFQYLLDDLGIDSFKQRFPWFGPDLQTLRDTFVDENLHLDESETIYIEVPSKNPINTAKENLIAFLNKPSNASKIKGLVLLLHGLGGSSRRRGLRRMAFAFLQSGFAVLRLNLRGAAPGRQFAAGTYAANCNSDIFPAIQKAREVCELLVQNGGSEKDAMPLLGVGISLGGTILLNACLEFVSSERRSALDGLACISSPLDLVSSSASIERPRNRLYQTWLLNRLVKQTLNDPFGILDDEKKLLVGRKILNVSGSSSIRFFDSVITSPRWGYKNVDDYYYNASPLKNLYGNTFQTMPKTLFVHSLDDPWVPSKPLEDFSKRLPVCKLSSKVDVLLTRSGGHNGFHGPEGCWGDEVIKCWLSKFVSRNV